MNRFQMKYCLVTITFLLTGCWGGDGPSIGNVSGYVTLDGEPLAAAKVVFVPTSIEGRPSFGFTDENGYYKLIFSSTRMGALTGDHLVKIATADDSLPDEERLPEKVPDRYREDSSELSAAVEAGSNEIDFDLFSE